MWPSRYIKKKPVKMITFLCPYHCMAFLSFCARSAWGLVTLLWCQVLSWWKLLNGHSKSKSAYWERKDGVHKKKTAVFVTKSVKDLACQQKAGCSHFNRDFMLPISRPTQRPDARFKYLMFFVEITKNKSTTSFVFISTTIQDFSLWNWYSFQL